MKLNLTHNIMYNENINSIDFNYIHALQCNFYFLRIIDVLLAPWKKRLVQFYSGINKTLFHDSFVSLNERDM
jgi:hypothetical protein